jgi:hypothetical protein
MKYKGMITLFYNLVSTLDKYYIFTDLMKYNSIKFPFLKELKNDS